MFAARCISRPASASDRLPLELQPPIARAMGFADEPRLIAEDGLMRAVFEHARVVRWIASNVLSRAANASPMPTDERQRRSTAPTRRWKQLADAAEAGERPGPLLLDRIEATPGARPGRMDGADPRGVPAHPSTGRRRRRGARRARPARAARRGSCPPGRTCGAGLSAIPTIGTRSTRISRAALAEMHRLLSADGDGDGSGDDELDDLDAGSAGRSRRRCCSARCCTTSARPGEGSHVADRRAHRRGDPRPAWASAARRGDSPRSWSPSTCCCPTRRRGATSPTRT